MRKTMLTVSPLVLITLSGCTTEAVLQSDTSSSIQKGEVSGNSDRTDWLTAWWKKSVPESIQHGVSGLGLNRWFPTSSAEDSAHGDTDEDGDHVSLWDTVGGRVTLADPNQPMIQKEANFYARNPRLLDHLSDQAEPYFNFVLGEVQRRNMPVEVALLPMVESAYEPLATSSHNAAGLWQLIPGTARRWGLDLTQEYDGRRDVSASTHAALDYLQKLSDEFGGDWLLAMAAYNCGELNVNHAIQRNLAHGKATDFWSLDLPAETRTFVPRVLGLASLIAEPQSYGVHLKALRDEPVTSVRVDYQVDLVQVATIADVPLQEVRRLNPAYRHGKTDPDGGTLLLPARQAQVFEERIASLGAQSPASATPLPIATTAMVVTDGEEDVRVRVAERPVASTKRVRPVMRTHVVRYGETLGSVAHAAGVTVHDIVAWNHLKPRAVLRTGQRLTIRMGTDSVALLQGDHMVNPHTHGGRARVKAVMFAQGSSAVHTRARAEDRYHGADSKLAHNEHTLRTHHAHS